MISNLKTGFVVEVPTLRLDVEGTRVDLSFGNSAGRAKSALVAGFLGEHRNLRDASALELRKDLWRF